MNFIGKIQASFIFDTTHQIKALIKGYPYMQYLHCVWSCCQFCDWISVVQLDHRLTILHASRPIYVSLNEFKLLALLVCLDHRLGLNLV